MSKNKGTKVLLKTALIALAVFIYPAFDALAAPVITVEKTAPSTSVNAGSNITYTITVRNNGDTTATGIVVRDNLNSNFNFVSSSPAPTTNTVTTSGERALTWSITDLAVGQSTSISLTADTPDVISTLTPVTNIARVDGSNFTTAQSAVITTNILQPNPVISVRKVPASAHISAGDTIFYQITVTNIGGSTANNVSVTDTLDPNTTFISASPSTTTTSGNVLTWNLGSISSQQTVTLNTTVRANTGLAIGTVIDNSLRVTGTNFTTVDAPSFISVVAPGSMVSPSPTPTPIGGIGGAGDELPRTGIKLNYLVLAILGLAAGISWKWSRSPHTIHPSSK